MLPENVFVSKNSNKLALWVRENPLLKLSIRKMDAYNQFGPYVSLDYEAKLEEIVDFEISPIHIICAATGHSVRWSARLISGEIHPDDALHYRLAKILARYCGVGLELGDWHVPPDEGEILADRPENGPIDSALWTGLPRKGVLNEADADRLKAALALVESAVERSGATNEEKAQARAYVMALQALSDAPEPPADLIWELVNRACQLSGIASLFVSVVALFFR